MANFKKMTFGKVIFDRELTFAKGKLILYIKQKLTIFTLPPPFSAEISYKKPTFPQQIAKKLPILCGNLEKKLRFPQNIHFYLYICVINQY